MSPRRQRECVLKGWASKVPKSVSARLILLGRGRLAFSRSYRRNPKNKAALMLRTPRRRPDAGASDRCAAPGCTRLLDDRFHETPQLHL
jgi:hypothetical protein